MHGQREAEIVPPQFAPQRQDIEVDGMTNTVRELHNVASFFAAISYKMDAYVANTFNYLAIKVDGAFRIQQARLFLNTGTNQIPFTHFQSENVRAGSYRLSDLNLSPRDVVERLLSGSLSTSHGDMLFTPNEGGNYLATYDPLHEAGQSTQTRFDILTTLGGAAQPSTARPMLDWELKASPTPYDNLQELALEYSLGPLRNVTNVEVVAYNVAAIDAASTITGTTGKLAVRLASGSAPERVALGYRVFVGGKVITRLAVSGSEMHWDQKDAFRHGSIDVDVPPAAVLHCVASYGGVAQSHYWVADPTTAPNARRVVYETADNQLEILSDLLTKSQTRGRDARELETGVAWLLWMLGFSVAHLGSTPRTQDAIDLIATTPNGHFAVIECTTGLLKADHKLPRVVERAESIRKRLAESGNRHLRVLATIVTSKSRGEIVADVEQAERLKVLVLTREDLEQSSTRTLAPPNADQIFEQGEQAVQAAAAKYDAQLPLPSPG